MADLSLHNRGHHNLKKKKKKVDLLIGIAGTTVLERHWLNAICVSDKVQTLPPTTIHYMFVKKISAVFVHGLFCAFSKHLLKNIE